MTAKSFFYASLGILLLVTAWTMGAQHARADFDDTNSLVVGYHKSGNYFQVIRADGTLWRIGNEGGHWALLDPNPTLPVPLNEVAFWSSGSLVTQGGHAWRRSQGQWSRISLEPLPPPTVSVEPSTWSGVKEGFRDKHED